MKGRSDANTASRPARTTVAERWVWSGALLALVLSGWLAARLVAREETFFRAHTAQQTRILSIPRELAALDAKIIREQQELVRVQKEIKRRLQRP